MSQKYCCTKCGNEEYSSEEIRTTGSGFSRFFDIQNKLFLAISCKKCCYTEFYKGKSNKAGNVLDFLIGG
jgi:predicted nucleic-acid-binding Zn-ribbon protein